MTPGVTCSVVRMRRATRESAIDAVAVGTRGEFMAYGLNVAGARKWCCRATDCLALGNDARPAWLSGSRGDTTRRR